MNEHAHMTKTLRTRLRVTNQWIDRLECEDLPAIKDRISDAPLVQDENDQSLAVIERDAVVGILEDLRNQRRKLEAQIQKLKKTHG